MDRDLIFWGVLTFIATIIPVILVLLAAYLGNKSANSYRTYKKERKKMEENVRRAIEYNERYEKEKDSN